MTNLSRPQSGNLGSCRFFSLQVRRRPRPGRLKRRKAPPDEGLPPTGNSRGYWPRLCNLLKDRSRVAYLLLFPEQCGDLRIGHGLKFHFLGRFPHVSLFCVRRLKRGRGQKRRVGPAPVFSISKWRIARQYSCHLSMG